MAASRSPAPRLVCRPLTPARWPDLLELFGPSGGCWGCWCMFFRQTGREFKASHGAPNRRRFQRLVKSGAATGLIAYSGREAVGWCSVAPRADYSRLARSRELAPVDDRPVWSVVCFFVPRRHRRFGAMHRLLAAAVSHAARHGAAAVEGYPVDSKGKRISDLSAYHGLASTFRAAGFREIARRSPTRPIMRREIRARRRPPGRAVAARSASGGAKRRAGATRSTRG